MKNIFKKITVAICAAAASLILVSAPVLANADGMRTPGEAVSVSNSSASTVTSSSGEQAQSGEDTAAAKDVTNNTDGDTAKSKHYLTRLGGFLWFLLSVIVNFILSCWIGNRFYKMAKKSAQGSGEIRALRKDIEEKFAMTLTDINEPAVEVLNRNESYARSDEGVAMPERKTHVELNDEEQEMMRRWDSKRTAARAARAAQAEDDFEEEETPRKAPVRRSYQPTRKSSGIEFDEEEYLDEETEAPQKESGGVKETAAKIGGKSVEALSSAKNKAKDFLSNVFPFEDQ